MALVDPASEPNNIAVLGDAVERFRVDLARLCDLESGHLLVGVSGGVDSLALLLLSHAVSGARLRAATVDHGLRPEAAAEAVFVAEVCASLGVPHAVLRSESGSPVTPVANLSSRARALRYALLEEHRIVTGCAWVATAHQQEDQVETLAMRLNRGSGLAGLSAVRPVNGAVVRPLLGWSRAELVALVSAAGLTPVLDPSNVDDRFDRARMRKALAGAEWVDVDRWCRSAAALAEAEEALSWLVRRLAEERIVVGADRVELRLIGDPPEIVRRLLTECLLRISPDARLRGGEVRELATRVMGAKDAFAPMSATLADVSVRTRADAGVVVVDFRKAPPRRGLGA